MTVTGIEAAWEKYPIDWLQPVRERGLAAFRESGFPSRRGEAWKYTDATPLAERSQAYLSASQGIQGDTPDLPKLYGDSLPVLLVNGRLSPGQKLPAAEGLRVVSLNEAPAALRKEILQRIERFPANPGADLSSLNAAFISDGLWIDIAPDTVLEHPIEILFQSDGAQSAAQPRIIVSAGANSHCKLIENYSGSGAGLINAVTDMHCDDGARLEWLKLQAESAHSLHVALQNLTLGHDSNARLVQIELGGKLARNDLRVRLAAPGAHVDVYGLFLADGQGHLDSQLEVRHQAENTTSRENYCGIAADQGRGIFNGKIIVEAGADGTDAKLSNRNLLLSEGAEIDTKPELEIYADDVKCAHGATTGELDETALFYLQSRGISLEDARGMLINAFAGDIVRQIPLKRLRRQVEAALGRRLGTDSEAGTP